jgi:hypothetical protein
MNKYQIYYINYIEEKDKELEEGIEEKLCIIENAKSKEHAKKLAKKQTKSKTISDAILIE